MPYKRTYAKKKAYRKPYKKYGKKYGKKRWTKKHFAKNTSNTLVQRATLAAKSLYVKLPWIKTFTTSIAAAGSSTYSFQGNGMVPYTSFGNTPGNTPNTETAGDLIPAGVQEYSTFYDKYVILGSSIKIEANNTSVATSVVNGNLRCVLIAIPYSSTNDTNDDWGAVRTQLNAYTYEQLLAWPYAKWRILPVNSSGFSVCYFKMFRKTKHMCNIKDMKDVSQSVLTVGSYGGTLPDGTVSAASMNNPDQGFMYFFKIFNLSAASIIDVNLTVKMRLYCNLFSREFNPIQTLV